MQLYKIFPLQYLKHLVTISLLCLSGIAYAETPQSLAGMASEAFERLNHRRMLVGLNPLQRNATLDDSASAHCRYLVKNNSLNTEGHGESAGRPGFTGNTPAERISAAGYTDPTTSENMALISYPLGALGTDNLIDAPYHRQAQLGAFVEAGVCMSTQPAPPNSVNPLQYIYVINFGGIGSITDNSTRLFTYPTNNQIDAPFDWIANESPNPVPDLNGQRVGYPISISADLTDTLHIDAFTLSDVEGKSVTGRLITSRTDNGKPLGSYAFWIPLQALNAGARYQAKAQGSLNRKAFSLGWSFTTRKASPLQLLPSAPKVSDVAGSTLSVQVSGGFGSNAEVMYSGQRYQYYGKINPKVTFVSASYPRPDHLILTRNATPCANNVAACEIIIRGKDSSGSQTELVLPVN
ncbi:MAG: CAP domain-containing protein [Gallionellaceae bacterium]|jgi:uncharacterized protein YkwD